LAEAIKALQTAVLIAPDHPEAHFNLAIAYEQDNSLSKALQEIIVSLHLAPEDPDERNTKGIICAELGISSARAMNGSTWSKSPPTTHPLESIWKF
jgi:tetratricopeptide (TPR) repeat protein